MAQLHEKRETQTGPTAKLRSVAGGAGCWRCRSMGPGLASHFSVVQYLSFVRIFQRKVSWQLCPWTLTVPNFQPSSESLPLAASGLRATRMQRCLSPGAGERGSDLTARGELSAFKPLQALGKTLQYRNLVLRNLTKWQIARWYVGSCLLNRKAALSFPSLTCRFLLAPFVTWNMFFLF